MKHSIIQRVAALAALAALGVCRAETTLTSEDYVQDGLIAHWDGIDNVLSGGERGHDSSSTIWSDLTGQGHDFDLADYIGTQITGFTDNSLQAKSCYKVPCANPDGVTNCKNYRTIEICAKHGGSGVTQALFNSGDGLKKFCAVKTGSVQFYNAASKNYDIGSGTSFQAACVHDAANAATVVVYTNGVVATQTQTTTWSGNNSVTCLGRGASSTYNYTGEYYAIRLYSRRLTERELEWNSRLDELRFMNASSPEKVSVSVTAGTGGTVEGGGVKTPGEEFTVTAKPSEGYTFGWWSGNLSPNLDATQSNLTIKASAMVTNLVAHFRKLVYVAKDGNDANGGTSWDDALASVAAALDKDDAPYVTVGPGLYPSSASIVIEKPAVIVGKAVENGTETIFKATASCSSVFMLSNEFARLENLAITTAGENYGRGVYLYRSGTVDNCVITNCYAYCSNGGGVYLHDGGTVRNTSIAGCVAYHWAYSNHGGGVYINGAGLVENCDIQGCHINSGGYGGGVYFSYGGTLRNSLVRGCYSKGDAPGIYMVGGGSVENCTITANYNKNSKTATALTMSGGSVINSIIWGNTNSMGAAGVSRTGGFITHCTHENELTGVGNLTVNPAFTDADGGDYTLTPSDCVDAGMSLPWHAGATDLNGDPRVSGKAVDLGCYELDAGSLAAAITYSSDGCNDKTEVTFTAMVSGATSATQTYAWHITSKQGYDEKRSGTDLSTLKLTLSPGEYTAELTVTDGEASVDAKSVGGIITKASHTYVAKDGLEVVPYASVQNAAKDVESALRFTGPGGTVHVGDGFYTMSNTISLENGERIRSENGPAAVTLHAAPSGGTPVVYLDHADSLLDGVTVSGCAEDGKTYASINHLVQLVAGGTVTNCVIEGNHTTANGAGVCMAKGLVVNTIVRNCKAGYDWASVSGFGVYMDGGTIHRCIITNNVIKTSTAGYEQFGAGVYIKSGTLSNSIVAGNELYYRGKGAGVYNKAGKIINCLVAGNKCRLAGTGVYQDGAGSLMNLTITGNMTNELDAVACYVTGKAKVQNCIVWGNEGEGNQLSDPPSGSTMNHNWTDDPKFVNAAVNDYHLAASSPAINAGILLDWMTADAVDLDGQPRVVRKKVDIGCYESQWTLGTIFIVR